MERLIVRLNGNGFRITSRGITPKAWIQQPTKERARKHKDSRKIRCRLSGFILFFVAIFLLMARTVTRIHPASLSGSLSGRLQKRSRR
jgi:hypothetical protein